MVKRMLKYSEFPKDPHHPNLTYCEFKTPKKRSDPSETNRTNLTRKLSNPLAMVVGPGPPLSTTNYGPLQNVTSPDLQMSSSAPKHYNCAIFDILHVSPEDFASQLTLLDLPIFRSIQPDELTSCAWNKRNKLVVAPNVVAFSKRFNHTGFWVVQEILSATNVKRRSDLLTLFVKIAKKLYDFNNLHSLFAIVAALQSASIFRLSKTWAGISKKDRQTFDRLSEVFSDEKNWLTLRRHIDSLKLPCIPYLGLYLTDLVYIDMAHPHSGGLESQQRTLKMNNILRVLANYQQSDYTDLPSIPHIQNYLNSIRYIEELQKFVEDDQYKLSLKLEPSTADGGVSCSSTTSSDSKESVAQTALDGATNVVGAIASLNLSPAKSSCGSLRLHVVTSAGKFLPGHRKCRSLGANRNHHQVDVKNETTTFFTKQQLHLLDDSELEETLTNSLPPSSRHAHSFFVRNQPFGPTVPPPNKNAAKTDEYTPLTTTRLCDDLLAGVYEGMEGCVRRKTVIKCGRRPTVTTWQRFWIQIWTSSLVYFAPKTFKGNQRSDFRHEPVKLCPLIGCEITANNCSDTSTSKERGIFQIFDAPKQTLYKFRVDNRQLAELWCRALRRAASNQPPPHYVPPPNNLMSFE